VKIAVLGGYGVGITMHLTRFPEAGETVLGGVLTHEHGGKGSNQAVGMARWGAAVDLITAIGNDAAGASARELWRREGIGTAAVHFADDTTMAGVILVDDVGENRIGIAAGALEQMDELDHGLMDEVIVHAEALVVSLEVPLAVAARAIDVARAASVLVVLNPAPADSVPHALWSSADLLVPNHHEARVLLGAAEGDDETLARLLHERTGRTVVLTCGVRGAVIADQEGVRAVPAVAVDAVDTTGAGDAFVAVLTVEYLESGSIDRAVETACAAAALAVTTRGVVDGLPRRDRRPATIEVSP
jgi:ribokinase